MIKMADFATVQNVIDLWRALSPAETTRVTALLPLVSDALRREAKKVGKDLDAMVEADSAYANLVELVTVDIIGRILRQETDGEPMSQESQSANGYVWSGSYAIPGGGIAQAIMNNDLKRLGFKRQRYGVIDFYGQD